MTNLCQKHELYRILTCIICKTDEAMNKCAPIGQRTEKSNDDTQLLYNFFTVYHCNAIRSYHSECNKINKQKLAI